MAAIIFTFAGMTTDKVQAQGYFTLTNGRLWMFDGYENDPDESPYKYPVGFDKANGWAEVHPNGGNNISLITERGTVYFALDTTDRNNPKIVTQPVVAGFTPLCAWYRTSYNGYYYQEWGGYRYYLIGSHDNGLSISKVPIGQPLGQTSVWYNWDYGAALTEVKDVNGNPKEFYYWLMYDERDEDPNDDINEPVWRLSVNSYQRPEDIIYVDYNSYPTDYYYYDDYFDGVDAHYPSGIGALYLPVDIEHHLASIDSVKEGYGLSGLLVMETSGNRAFGANERLNYGASLDVTIQLATEAGEVPMLVTPEYYKYVEEVYRRGIHPDYTYRTENTFGSAGVDITETHYYNEDHVRIDRKPDSSWSSSAVKSVSYSIDNRSLRYLDIHAEGFNATLTCSRPPIKSHKAYITTTIHYYNGIEEHRVDSILLVYDKEPVVVTPTHGPVIRGSVFGGGRIANVGYDAGYDNTNEVTGGNTNITVHSADSIYAIYGGNDIAGWVQGQANINIGTKFTCQEHPVHIGWVYGGGCGYYSYENTYNATKFVAGEQAWAGAGVLSGNGIGYSNYCFKGKVYKWGTKTPDPSAIVMDQVFDYSPYDGLTGFNFALAEKGQGTIGDKPSGTIPYIKSAHITVGIPEKEGTPLLDEGGHSTHHHNDYILIDSLFGGAENAFIGVTSTDDDHPENGVTIDINGGTIYTVFGGNNYGGSVADKSTVYIDVYDTKLVDTATVVDENTYFTGFGRDFGIRYLFGGGNKVEGSFARVNIYGGMCDTVYLGGNSASVKQPIGLIDCRRNNGVLNEYGYDGHFICSNPTYPDNSTFTNNDPSSVSLDGFGPNNFSPEEGNYNVRCLFGGNNDADMENLSLIQLNSGGVSCVYGGSNSGDMKNATALDIPVYQKLFMNALDINPETGEANPNGWADIFGMSAVPHKVGSIVSAMRDSKIVCDYVFGGSRMGNVTHSCGVYLAGGIYGYVNGGNDVSGDIGSQTGGGTFVVLDSNVLVVGDAIAGSDGFYHCDNGTGHYDESELFDTYANEGESFSYDPFNDFVGMLLPTHNNTNIYMRGGHVLGQVVSGGVHADVGFKNGASPLILTLNNEGKRVETALKCADGDMHGKIRMLLSGGHIYNNAFGGGFQSNTYGLAYLRVTGDIQIDGSLFAGNDCAGHINAFGPYYKEIDYTGAVTKADSTAREVAAYAAFTNTKGEQLNNMDDPSYNSFYDAYLRIDGTPRIGCVYGSGNGAYNYNGKRPQYEMPSFCPAPAGEELRPLQSSTLIDINISGHHPKFADQPNIDTIFGGGNGVGVEKKVVVLLNNPDKDIHSVHTIFGGNNIDDMASVVPEIRLEQGVVNTVFGGSNNGKMGAKETRTDTKGEIVKNVSTHVKVNSDKVTVKDTIFGGNRMSDVAGTAFIEVKNTNEEGVNYIFGGNDISGEIAGGTRIDVSGGKVNHLFGGSNGRYDFVEVEAGLYNVYPFGSIEEGDTAGNLITIAARPDVDSTSVNVFGGTVQSSLYGGGSMADCRSTYVSIEDEATIHATIFGGGMGDWENLNNRNLDNSRYGNVTEATHVHLRKAKEVSTAKAYGGGKGGDVLNTNITVYPTWTKSFDELYGGCWGSDVRGTAHVIVNATDNGEQNVVSLFGGNDFAGDVYKSNITINSGRFNNVFGAGNGDHDVSEYSTGVYAGANKNLKHPNTEYVEMTFNNGTVDQNLYGGGKMGTTFAYKKNANGEYVYNNGNKVPDTTLTTDEAHTNPLDYSYIIVNVHDGTFNRDIYAGAKGSESDKKNLVYGLKVLNMDGGYVKNSVYGGSESSHDGYPAECKSSSNTTKRPSSIVNLTGGIVENNLYGAGYLGKVFGSAFVNVGPDAIDSCKAYTNTYKGIDSAYWKFKPGVNGGYADALGTSELLLNHSIYAGSNWGPASGTAQFTAAGFAGGESKVIIDGKGYNTDNDELNSLPVMNIQKSVFCSGTSVEGGDINNSKSIDIWNYGSMVNCQPSKKLESVQRSDRLMFHNSVIELTGATDGTSAYYSNPFSVNNVSHINYRGYNVIQYNATVTNIADMYFYDEDLSLNGNPQETELTSLTTNYQFNAVPSACEPDATLCEQYSIVDPDDQERQHTLMIVDNGVDFTIGIDMNDDGTWIEYSPLFGYGYVTTTPGYTSNIYGALFGAEDGKGGFIAPCEETNKWTDIYADDENEVGETWVDYEDCNDERKTEIQHPFENQDGGDYDDLRVWRVGKGARLREATILAHSDPTKLSEDVSIITHGNTNMAIAEVPLTLPATSTGHYYKVVSGINLSGENETVNLIDSAFVPAKDFPTINSLYTGGQSVDNNDSYGEFLGTSLTEGGVAQNLNEIIDHPNRTFGLVMVPGEFFDGYTTEYYQPSNANFRMPNTSIDPSKSMFVLSGNSYVTSTQNYCSPKVKSGTNILPVMKFYLTYNTEFATAFLGTVEFTLMEYDENGNEVAPVNIKIYISTIIEEFKPINTNVLAMYNAGRTNNFTRRVVLPATLDENRELYIKSAYWVPTAGNGIEDPTSTRFYLTDDTMSIFNAAAGVNNIFNIKIIPSDNVSSDIASSIAWSHIDNKVIDLFADLKTDHTSASRYSDSTAANTPDSIILYNKAEGVRGYRIGTLDGRGMPVLNVQLTFDGSRNYPAIDNKGYIGKVILNLESYLRGQSVGEFPLTIYVKTREHGDTIYIASAESVTRGEVTVHPYYSNLRYQELVASEYDLEKEEAAKMVGKYPDCYVRTFQQALSSAVYQEGDVVAILDTVKINEGIPISIHGGDGPAIEVIRYDGHHAQLAGEAAIYRGPMIQIKGEGNMFSAQNIAFHGGAGSIIAPGTNGVINDSLDAQGHPIILPGDIHLKVAVRPDTNRVFAPIFQVLDNGVLNLKNFTTVKHNWNAYGSIGSQRDSDGMPKLTRNMGAISLVNGGTLNISNNVTLSQNLSHTFNLDCPDSTYTTSPHIQPSYDALRPANGAVYIDGGRLVLPESDRGTGVKIQDNYLVDIQIHSNNPNVKWWTDVVIDGKVVRYSFDETKVSSWDKANVLLTRKAGTPNTELDDSQSDLIYVNGTLGSNTRIGVRKWFPGQDSRDTISFAVCGGSNLTVLKTAIDNNNFFSDDDNKVFYNNNVNNSAIYFFRCATFKHQLATNDLPISNGSNIYPANDVLTYGYSTMTSCPIGGDTLFYHVQGGFMPYTFSWNWSNPTNIADEKHVSSYANTLVQSKLKTGDASYYLSSITDTMLIPAIPMTHAESYKNISLNVTAIDATGECSLTKDVEITLHKVASYEAIPNDHSLWQPATSPNGWADTATRVAENKKTAIGNRYYKAITITPYVWIDHTRGSISAVVDGDDNDYVYKYDESENRHELASLLFCEGDIIKLKTSPPAPGAKFLMWDFAPFYSNPATYIVPPYNDTVIAYYGPTQYWHEMVNSENIAGAVAVTSYDYTERPNTASGEPAGYVTTYNGDVHIYDENGLAWFISVVNGLNGNQMRPFYFNKVFIHEKADGNEYDMKDYLWTPVGSMQYGFRGDFIGVSSDPTDTVASNSFIEVKNVIIDEPDRNFVGFFGQLDTATISSIELNGVFARGGQYVGAMAASAVNTTIDNCAIGQPTEAEAISTILTTHYASGGMVGEATNTEITKSKVNATYVGDAIYTGGIAGYGSNNQITDNAVEADFNTSGIYSGGAVGNESSSTEAETICLSGLSAIQTGRDANGGYIIHVQWSTTASRVQVGYCVGDSWDETIEMTEVTDSSIDLHLYRTDTSVHGFTIAVKAYCTDSQSEILTEYVRLEDSNDDPDCCPTYNLDTYIDPEGSVTMLRVQWDAEGCESTIDTMVKVGYCIGTTWSLDSAIELYSYPSFGNDGAAFQLETVATAYTVGIYSPCSGEWKSTTVQGNTLCPTYTIDATYATNNEVTHVSHTVTMTWQTTSEITEDQVEIGICPGSQWDNSSMTPVSANTNSSNGMSSYTFNVDNFPATSDVYTVAFKSPCSGYFITKTIGTNSNGNTNNYGPQMLASANPRAMQQRNRRMLHSTGNTTNTQRRSIIANNYIKISNNGRSQRIGGIAGYSKNVDISNNYVYGDINTQEPNGSVVAVMDHGTRADGNYSARGTASANVGVHTGGSITNSAQFKGQGNQVMLDKNINGVNNLTRVLNHWVREQNAAGANYRTWRSDLEGVNSGYPIFGTPDTIPVYDSALVYGCDSAEWDGQYYADGDTIMIHVVDHDELVDSIMILRFVVRHSSTTELQDSGIVGEEYNGYGFHMSASETELLLRTVEEHGYATVILSDTYTSMTGCDSTVTLTLTFRVENNGNNNDTTISIVTERMPEIKVYPNPTTSKVTIETERMSKVEIFDNEGRRLEEYPIDGDSSTITLDITNYSSGVYYLRVHTPQRVNIQKVIKR